MLVHPSGCREATSIVEDLGVVVHILSSQGDMRKRYGVVYVNRTNHDLRDMRRVPKKSYHWLKRVIESDGEEM